MDKLTCNLAAWHPGYMQSRLPNKIQNVLTRIRTLRHSNCNNCNKFNQILRKKTTFSGINALYADVSLTLITHRVLPQQPPYSRSSVSKNTYHCIIGPINCFTSYIYTPWRKMIVFINTQRSDGMNYHFVFFFINCNFLIFTVS
jgi:hypothetical protein